MGKLDSKKSLSMQKNTLDSNLKPKRKKKRFYNLSCDICDKKFGERCSLERHRIIHYEELTGLPREKIYACDLCNKKYLCFDTLKRHKKLHYGDPEECQDCGKLYRDKGTLNRHRLAVHLQRKPYKCEICGKRFSRHYDLRNHQGQHADEYCKLCKTLSSDHSYFGACTHADEKKYECDVCGAKFFNIRTYKLHNCDWGNIEIFRCRKCYKRFIERSELEVHNTIHSNEPLETYECSGCEKVFNYKHSLKTHYEAVHSGEKPYKCEACGRTFAVKLYLLRHTRTRKCALFYASRKCKKAKPPPAKKYKVSPITCFEEADESSQEYDESSHDYDGLSLRASMLIDSNEISSRTSNKEVLTPSSLESSPEKEESILTFEEKASLKKTNMYKCDNCNKEFSVENSYLEHILNQCKDQIYPCDECSASFTRLEYLHIHSIFHQKRLDLWEKPKLCILSSDERRHNQQKTNSATKKPFLHLIKVNTNSQNK